MRRVSRWIAASACATLLLARTATAAASLELEWRAPSGCPDRDWVLTEISRFVTPPAKLLQARARVTRVAAGFHVDIELTGAAQGSRALRANSCASIARATALIVALAIDPQVATLLSEEMARSTESERAESILGARPTPVASASSKPASTGRDSPRAVLDAGMLVEQALVPRLALGGALGAGVEWRWARADVGVGVIPRASTTLEGNPGVGANFTLAFLTLRGCAGHVRNGAALSACAAVRGSRVWASAIGASESFAKAINLLSLEPGLLVRVPASSSFGFELSANGVIPLRRPRFVVTEAETQHELFRPGAIGAAMKLGIAYTF